jgi:hypothetical protein
MSAPDGISPSEAGVDSNAMAVPDPPPRDWSEPGYEHRQPPEGLDRIHERMSELSDQVGAQAEEIAALRYAQPYDEYDGDEYDGYEDEDYDEDYGDEDEAYDEDEGIELTPEDLALVDGAINRDVFDLFDRSVQGRMAEADARRDAEEALVEREEAFEELRERLPLRQDEDTAREFVHMGVELAERWGAPEIIEGPALVDLIRLLALGSVGMQTIERERVGQQQPRREVMLESAAGGGPSGDNRSESQYWAIACSPPPSASVQGSERSSDAVRPR